MILYCFLNTILYLLIYWKLTLLLISTFIWEFRYLIIRLVFELLVTFAILGVKFALNAFQLFPLFFLNFCIRFFFNCTILEGNFFCNSPRLLLFPTLFLTRLIWWSPRSAIIELLLYFRLALFIKFAFINNIIASIFFCFGLLLVTHCYWSSILQILSNDQFRFGANVQLLLLLSTRVSAT